MFCFTNVTSKKIWSDSAKYCVIDLIGIKLGMTDF